MSCSAATGSSGQHALSGPLPEKERGVILGIVVLLDAALVRLQLIGVLLRLPGRWARWLPEALDRVLPHSLRSRLRTVLR